MHAIEIMVGRSFTSRTKIWILPQWLQTHLVAKQEHEEAAKRVIADTDIYITINGIRHLGAALGSRPFTEEYVSNKVQSWVQEISHLTWLG